MELCPQPYSPQPEGGTSNTIGIVIPQIVHYFFSQVISGAEDYANDKGYNVMICQSNEKYENEVKNIQTLLNSHVGGMIVSISKLTRNMEHFREIMNKNIPLVFFDRICEELDTDRVTVDDEEGAYMAVKHLILEGKKKIVHLSGPPNLRISKDRIEGYIRALNEFRIPVNEENIVKCDQIEEAQWIIPSILKRNPVPDAFFSVNDLTAAETLIMVKQHGFKVPDDIAVVGFTNGQISKLTDPGLSTVDQHGYEMGQEAARLLLDRIKDRSRPTQSRVIKTELIVRGSSSRLTKS